MSRVAIRAEGLSKMYRVPGNDLYRGSYRTLRDDILALPRRLTSRRVPRQSFWALRDVSFQVRQGEVLGIVGRNGAGKSTLLKLLSRVTEPTTGQAELYGRVGTLLEVGTGFHPELTGRENIYLSGAILGMRRREIQQRFDQIVEFAEVEKFIDTPVKHFSSGMYLRLAFSVAAHLDPEILIVDEVLAVGDAAFQKKCLGKMDEVAHQGRAILFVSHDMASIARLSQRTLLLEGGQVLTEGPPETVIAEYLRSVEVRLASHVWEESGAPGNEIVRLRAVRIRNAAGTVAETHDIREPIRIEMEYDVLSGEYSLVPGVHLVNAAGTCLLVSLDPTQQRCGPIRARGSYISTMTVPGNFLAEGSVSVRVAMVTLQPEVVHFDQPDAATFSVIDRLEPGSVRDGYAGEWAGVVRPLLEWSTQSEPSRA